MKKWPSEWVALISKHLNGAVEYGRAEASKLARAQSAANFNWAPILEEMDAAGMLKDIPEPLEIDYCTVHGSQRAIVMGSEFSRCEIAVRYLASTHNVCEYKKMREVEE